MSSAIAEVTEKTFSMEEPQMRMLQKGDRLRCRKCGLEIQVTANCKCGNGHHVRFECCGQPLAQL